MKKFLTLILVLSSFNLLASCPNIPDGQLNSDQLIVKELLASAKQLKNDGQINKDLSAFTHELKKEYTVAADFLDEKEIASFIIEQDNDDNICPNQDFPSSETFKNLIVDKIFDTYYGCGCEQ